MATDTEIRKLIVSMAAYTAVSIAGPIVVFGGAGYALSSYFGGKAFIFVGIGVAFVVTMILQSLKVKKLMVLLDARETGSSSSSTQ